MHDLDDTPYERCDGHATTTYQIQIGGVTIETESAFIAQLESEAGSRVTAVTEGQA